MSSSVGRVKSAAMGWEVRKGAQHMTISLNGKFSGGPLMDMQMPDNTSHAAPALVQRHRSDFADDPDMSDLIVAYVGRLPIEVARMKSLLQEKQIEPLRRVVHQLKGSGGGYGFARVTELAAAADCSIKEGAALDRIQGQIHSLIHYIRDIHGYNSSTEALHAAKHPNH